MNRSALNMKLTRANSRVSLFWPPTEPGGCALIVNGPAACEHRLTGVTMAEITLTKSVLHCPGPKPDDSDGPYASDCRRPTWMT